jgi:hypothetical protein
MEDSPIDEGERTMPESNPRITNLLRQITFIEFLVLLGAGLGLFLMPDYTHDIWGWELTPFNTRFLGAIYLSASLPIIYMVAVPYWSPTRPVLWIIFVFTGIILLVSLMYTDKFDFDKGMAWAWFVLYIALPISAGFHLWKYRSLPTTHLAVVPLLWRYALAISALIMLGYGLGLLILPDTFSELFPWVLDKFHSQLYSATFIGIGVGVFTIAHYASSAEWLAIGITLVAVAIWVILGLVIVDADTNRIDWSWVNTWVWLAIFGAGFILGVALMAASRRQIPN